LVIGVNDAERIRRTDITIFHADWVRQALSEIGPTAQLYITSTDFSAAQAATIHAPHISLAQESGDLMMQRLLSGDFVIEDVLFISALKVALEVARHKKRRQKVYMVGFDFDAAGGYATVSGLHYEQGDAQKRKLMINMQENFLLNALYMLSGEAVDVQHVGYRSFSRLTPEELTSQFAPAEPEGQTGKWGVSVVA
jgi:N-acetylneuraminate synthase